MWYLNYINTLVRMMAADGIFPADLSGFISSMDDCIVRGQFTFLKTEDGQDLGFYSWEIQQSENDRHKLDVGIINLVIFKKHRGQYNLMKIVRYLRSKYAPNIDKICWHNLRRNEMRNFKQRGFYALK